MLKKLAGLGAASAIALWAGLGTPTPPPLQAQITEVEHNPDFIPRLLRGEFLYEDIALGDLRYDDRARLDLLAVYQGMGICRLNREYRDRLGGRTPNLIDFNRLIFVGELETGAGFLVPLHPNYLRAVSIASTTCESPQTQLARYTIEKGILDLIDRQRTVDDRRASGEIPLMRGQVHGIRSIRDFKVYSETVYQRNKPMFDSQVAQMAAEGIQVLRCWYGPTDPVANIGERDLQLWYQKTPTNLSAMRNSIAYHPAAELGSAAAPCCPSTLRDVEATRAGSHTPICYPGSATQYASATERFISPAPCSALPQTYPSRTGLSVGYRFQLDLSERGDIINARLNAGPDINGREQFVNRAALEQSLLPLAESDIKKWKFSPQREIGEPVPALNVSYWITYRVTDEDFARCNVERTLR